MSRAIVRHVPIDPEYQEVYDAEVVESTTPSKHKPGQVRKLQCSEDSDDVMAAIEMARDNERFAHRKDFKDGSFDQVEHDVSNVGRLLVNFLTR